MELTHAISRCLSGDKKAYEAVVESHADKLVHLLIRVVGNVEDARDVAQETFIRAYMNLHRYDPNRPFTPWLYRIARNLAYNHLKATGRRVSTAMVPDGEKYLESFKSETNTPEEGVLEGERRDQVDNVLNLLREEFREVLMLRYIERLEYEEIAEAMGIPVGTVKTWLNRAKEQFRRHAEGSEIF